MSFLQKQNITPLDNITPFSDLLPIWPEQGDDNTIVIAGPCSAESEKQVMETALALKKLGVSVFRAGLWKPRTLPGGFEGVGKRGLPWLQRVKKETGLLIATEVATKQHVDAACQAGVDVLWIGARTTSNPFAVQEVADSLSAYPETCVLVKNPLSNDINLWVGALQRIYNAGIRHLAAVHRGFQNASQQTYRNEPQWSIPIELKQRYPALPVIVDPSHIAGQRPLVPIIAQEAMDMGFDGIMVEAHIRPDEALSDSQQQISPAQLRHLLDNLIVKHKKAHDERLSKLRSLIDQCDDELLQTLARRMEIVRLIGQHKSAHNMAIVQNSRFNDVLHDRAKKAEALGLSKHFAHQLMQLIHQEAVDQQRK